MCSVCIGKFCSRDNGSSRAFMLPVRWEIENGKKPKITRMNRRTDGKGKKKLVKFHEKRGKEKEKQENFPLL